jgi:hypothetical protein
VGHQTDLTVIAHPDRRLMGAKKTLYRRVFVIVGADADFVFTGHGRPVRHAEWCGNTRNHPAIVVFSRAGCADHWIDIINRLLSESIQFSNKIKSEAQHDKHCDEGRRFGSTRY